MNTQPKIGFSTDKFMLMMMMLKSSETRISESITLTVPQIMQAIADWEKKPQIETMGNWTGISCQWPGLYSVHWKLVEEEEEDQKPKMMIAVNRNPVLTFTPEGADDPDTFVPPVWLTAGSPERSAELIGYMKPKAKTAPVETTNS